MDLFECTTTSQTMRFILVVIAALASSISATPADVIGARGCPAVCKGHADCQPFFKAQCFTRQCNKDLGICVTEDL
ncbi:hypothetical protein F4604DRAFT_1795557 [Suillus subluteus]|nr:hypothetical protein F4604DRAFT_1795557 [Suillus subluteus]